jgi:aspartate racemase
VSKEKVVGILGGMGPLATVEFFRQVVLSTPARKDWEHLRIIIDNNAKIPSRTRAVLYREDSPVPMMIASINLLANAGADFVVVPCNSAHYFYDNVTPYIRIPWLNMIDITSRTFSGKWQRPLVLGGYITVEKRLYSRCLPGAVYPAGTWNTFVTEVIEEIKLTAKLRPQMKDRFKEIIKYYRHEIDSVLLACTELPLVYKSKSLYGVPVVDSGLEYAREVIRYARGSAGY